MSDRRPLPSCDCGHPAHRISAEDLADIRTMLRVLTEMHIPWMDKVARLCDEYERQGEELADALLDAEGERHRSDAMAAVACRYHEGWRPNVTGPDGRARWSIVRLAADGENVISVEPVTDAEREALAELEADDG